ncbi:unnamed protein product [Schistocephalus solidus]|uniref:YcgL domain-containing protein n=1 Tax=Schistocephalus solidus TaxID=70667 RepID=A0A183S7T4_SCHSO|nr:unnamed protein product [Schistocephalus solidus]
MDTALPVSTHAFLLIVPQILYTDFARYCPEDVEEVVELLTEAELRLRTPLDEVDLLLTSKPVNAAD